MEIYVLIILFVLAVICLDLNNISKNKRDFDAIIRIALVFVLIHVVIAFIGRTLPEQYGYVDWAAPFGFLYGPLLYIGYLSFMGRMLGRKKIIGHLLPFLTASLCYILYLFLPPELQLHIGIMYAHILYLTMALSWLIYIIWVGYLLSREKGIINIAFKNLLSSVVIVLFTLATFLTVMIYIRTVNGIKSSGITPTLMFYLGILGGVVLIYQFLFRRFKEELSNIVAPTSSNVGIRKQEVAAFRKLEYQKSSLKEEIMIAYSAKVNAFIESGAYLDIDLDLGKLAIKLKIPKHHLSQLFSQYYKQGFLEYINTLRIRHACNILNDPKANINITNLAEQCGFKSKPSFYRNFKSITGMTPTDFRSSFSNPPSS